MSSNIYRVREVKSENGILVYTIQYKSGRERLEVERFLPETVKTFIRQHKGTAYTFYNGILDRYEKLYM